MDFGVSQQIQRFQERFSAYITGEGLLGFCFFHLIIRIFIVFFLFLLDLLLMLLTLANNLTDWFEFRLSDSVSLFYVSF